MTHPSDTQQPTGRDTSHAHHQPMTSVGLAQAHDVPAKDAAAEGEGGLR